VVCVDPQGTRLLPSRYSTVSKLLCSLGDELTSIQQFELSIPCEVGIVVAVEEHFGSAFPDSP